MNPTAIKWMIIGILVAIIAFIAFILLLSWVWGRAMDKSKREIERKEIEKDLNDDIYF